MYLISIHPPKIITGNINFVNDSFAVIIFFIFITTMFTSCKSVKSTFEMDLKTHFEEYNSPQAVVDSAMIQDLPEPIRMYLIHSGFVGKEIPVNAEIIWDQSAIKMKPDRDWMKLKTIQFNSVKEPFRIAYMKATLFGIIPFEGRDMYGYGTGHMYGKIGNFIKVFDEKEKEIAQSALIIILAECLLVPGYALQNYIKWEEIDNYTASAMISHGGITARGIFHFNEDHELVLFETDDRFYMSPEKGNVLTPFSAEIGDYFRQGDLKVPGSLMAIWHLETGRYEYWKGTIQEIRYNIQL
jgi:hypothetical protein